MQSLALAVSGLIIEPIIEIRILPLCYLTFDKSMQDWTQGCSFKLSGNDLVK